MVLARIIPCTFSVLVVDIYVAENSEWKSFFFFPFDRISWNRINLGRILRGTRVDFYEIRGKGLMCKFIQDGNTLHFLGAVVVASEIEL